MQEIQPGQQVTIEINGNSVAGHVTHVEGGMATVAYDDQGRFETVERSIDSLLK